MNRIANVHQDNLTVPIHRYLGGSIETSKEGMFYLENILNLVVKRLYDRESLIIEFESANFVVPLELQTKPRNTITWGTSLELLR